MDTRFVQAHKEARWALGLTLLYLAVWLVATYLSGVAPGFTGFPRILIPLLPLHCGCLPVSTSAKLFLLSFHKLPALSVLRL